MKRPRGSAVHPSSLNIYFPYYTSSYNSTCAPGEDSDQPAHQRNIFEVFSGYPVASQ